MDYDALEKQLDDVKLQVNDLKIETSEMQKDIAIIKVQLTNHIPTALKEIGVTLNSLEARIKPMEIKNTKLTGVSEFLTLILKAFAILIATGWSTIQIIKFFVH